jgi:hypothetical protein
MCLEAGKSRICRKCWKVENRADVVQIQRLSAGGISSHLGRSVLNRLDEVLPYYGGNLLCSKSTNLNTNLIQNPLHRNIQNNV